jgi:saccharopine dehydrogenase-like NADP-dependent oxidoreductase
MVVKPLVDYLIDTCCYRTVLTDITTEGAARLLHGRELGMPVAWTAGDARLLHQRVQEADIVVSMLPPGLHLEVAEACLAHCRHLVTTSYISDGMAGLQEQAKDRDLVFLNEVGESPGLDHMGALALIAQARGRGEEILELRSYAGGLPAFRSNTNPWGYKFSWSPRGVFKAAQSPAVYLDRGTRMTVKPEDLFGHCRLVEIDGVGSFETYPNRDATRYLAPYGLRPDVSLYRGILRHRGWCAILRALRILGLLDDAVLRKTDGLSYAEFLAGLIGCSAADLRSEVARVLGLELSERVIAQLEWLGLFDMTGLRREEGTALDVFLDLALSRLAYCPGEQDMVAVHNELVGRAGERLTRNTATLMAEGIPDGDSAMARAVGLTAGIATRLVVEGVVTCRGVIGPWEGGIHARLLDEMAGHGFRFAFRQSSLLCSS